MKKLLCALCAGVAFLSLGLSVAKAWSLEEASKDYKGVPEFRPRFAEWPQLSEIIAEWGTKMQDGQATVQQASDEIDKRFEDVLKKAGYYDGKKTLAQ